MTEGKQAGLTLIELMIALVLSSVIFGVVIQIYTQVVENVQFDSEYALIRHKSRLLFDVLASSIKSSGAYGCKDTNFKVIIHQDSHLSKFDFTHPISGMDYDNGVWKPALFVLPTGIDTRSDVLIVRGPIGSFSLLAASMTDAAQAIPVGVGKDIKANDVLAVSDCVGTEIFSVGNNDVNTTGLVKLSGASDNVTTKLSRAYGVTSEIVPVGNSLYFVKDDPYGIPAFWVKVNNQEPEIIARGVERFDVSYGIDSDEDGSVNGYLSAHEWDNLGAGAGSLVSLRVAFLVRNLNYVKDARGGATLQFGSGLTLENIAPEDGVLRKMFNYTFILKNPTHTL